MKLQFILNPSYIIYYAQSIDLILIDLLWHGTELLECVIDK